MHCRTAPTSISSKKIERFNHVSRVYSTSILLLHYNIPNIVIQSTLWTLNQRKRERRNTYVHKDSIFVKWHHVGFLRWDKSGRDRKKRNNLMQPTWVKNKFVRVQIFFKKVIKVTQSTTKRSSIYHLFVEYKQNQLLFQNSCWLCIHFWIKWELGKIFYIKMIRWTHLVSVVFSFKCHKIKKHSKFYFLWLKSAQIDDLTNFQKKEDSFLI